MLYSIIIIDYNAEYLVNYDNHQNSDPEIIISGSV